MEREDRIKARYKVQGNISKDVGFSLNPAPYTVYSSALRADRCTYRELHDGIG